MRPMSAKTKTKTRPPTTNGHKPRADATVPTPAELECLRMLAKLNRRNAPDETSIAELSRELGYAHPNGVQRLLASCEYKGFVAAKKVTVSRGRQLTAAGSRWL